MRKIVQVATAALAPRTSDEVRTADEAAILVELERAIRLVENAGQGHPLVDRDGTAADALRMTGAIGQREVDLAVDRHDQAVVGQVGGTCIALGGIDAGGDWRIGGDVQIAAVGIDQRIDRHAAPGDQRQVAAASAMRTSAAN